MKKLLLILSFGLGLLHAEIVGGFASDYMDYGLGARHLAMGRAGRTVANDSLAGYWNSAKITDVKLYSLNTSFEPLLMGGTHSQIGVVFPGLLAINYVDVNIDSIEKHTIVNSTPEGYFGARNGSIMASYGLNLAPKMALGVTGKYNFRSVDDDNDSTLGLDVGWLVRSYPFLFWKVDVGRNIRNLYVYQLSGITDDTMELDLDIGMSTMLTNRLLVAADFARILRQGYTYYFGAEYTLISRDEGFVGVALRGGVNTNEVSLGIGIETFPIRIDYAFVVSSLEVKHLFTESFEVDFGELLNFAKESKANQQKLKKKPVKKVQKSDRPRRKR
jgi:hypothetical protein